MRHLCHTGRVAAASVGSPPDLGVAVIHHRTPEVALKCLELVRAAAPHADVVLVDTAPDEAFLHQLGESFPDVTVLRVANHSYSHSVNEGLAALSNEHLVLMNADVFVEHDTFDRLVAALAAVPGRGVAGPLALTPAGKPQPLGLPYLLAYARLAFARLANAHLTRGGSSLKEHEPAAGRPAAVKVAWLSGCLQLVTRAAWAGTGGYDESFRFFNEDTDFCYRARAAGFASCLVDAPVVHLGGASTPDAPEFFLEGRRGGMVLTLRHHGPWFRWAHTAFLWLEAKVGTRTGPAERRGAYDAILQMLEGGDWTESPFGATLSERRDVVAALTRPGRGRRRPS